MPIPALGRPTGNPIFGYADWSDLATLETTSVVEGTNVLTNLQTDQPTEVFSAEAGGTISILCDRGSPQLWNMVQLLFHNGTEDAIWRIRSGDTIGVVTGAGSYDSGNMPLVVAGTQTNWARKKSWHQRRDSAGAWVGQSSRYILVDVTDPTNPDLFFRCGRLVIGAFWQSSRAQSISRTFGYDDNSKRANAVGGPRIATAIEPEGTQRFTVSMFGAAAYDEACDYFDELSRVRGSSRSVVVMVRPDDPVHAHRDHRYGTFTKGPMLKQERYQQFDATIGIESLL